MKRLHTIMTSHQSRFIEQTVVTHSEPSEESRLAAHRRYSDNNEDRDISACHL